MSKKKEKRGRYMDEWAPDKKSETMSTVAKHRWSKMSPEERTAFAAKMVEARKKKALMQDE